MFGHPHCENTSQIRSLANRNGSNLHPGSADARTESSTSTVRLAGLDPGQSYACMARHRSTLGTCSRRRPTKRSPGLSLAEIGEEAEH